MAHRRLDDLAQVVRILERIRAEGIGVDDITACLKIAAVQRDDLIRMRQVPRFRAARRPSVRAPAGSCPCRRQKNTHSFPKRSVSFISLYLLKLQSVLPHSSQPLRWQSCFSGERPMTAVTDLIGASRQLSVTVRPILRGVSSRREKITLMLDGKIAVAGTEARTAVQPLLLRRAPAHHSPHHSRSRSWPPPPCRITASLMRTAEARAISRSAPMPSVAAIRYTSVQPLRVAREIRACDGEITDLHRILPGEGQREAGGDAFRLHSRLKLGGTAFQTLPLLLRPAPHRDTPCSAALLCRSKEIIRGSPTGWPEYRRQSPACSSSKRGCGLRRLQSGR